MYIFCIAGGFFATELPGKYMLRHGSHLQFLQWHVGLLWWLKWSRICLQCKKPGFSSCTGKIPWRREWQPTPVFLPGESHGQRSLVGWSPWGHTELDTTEQLTVSLSGDMWHFGLAIINQRLGLCSSPMLFHSPPKKGYGPQFIYL